MSLTQYSEAQAYITVEDTNGPVDLSGAQVFFLMKKASGEQGKIPCNIIDASTGKVRVPFSGSDLSENGTYEFQLKIIQEDNGVVRTKLSTLFVEQSLPDSETT